MPGTTYSNMGGAGGAGGAGNSFNPSGNPLDEGYNGGVYAGLTNSLIGSNGPPIQGPSTGSYGTLIGGAYGVANQAQSAASGFLGASAYQNADANAQAGLAQTQGNLADVAKGYQNMPNLAQLQFQQGLDQSTANQLAMARSTQGGPAAQAAAMRQAQYNNGMTNAGAAGQAGIVRANALNQSLAGQAGAYGQIGGLQQAGGELSLQNQGQQNQMQQSLYSDAINSLGTSNQGYGTAGSILQGYNTALTADQALMLQQTQNAAANNLATESMAANAFGSVASAGAKM